MKTRLKISFILLLLASCAEPTQKGEHTSMTASAEKVTGTIAKTESTGVFLSSDSMRYENEDIPNIREILKVELINKGQFDSIRGYQNQLLKKFDDRFVDMGNESYQLQLDGEGIKTFNPEEDLYYHLAYYGHVDPMDIVLFYVSDDDDEAPYRLYSAITGEKRYHLRQKPSFSPGGHHVVYVDDAIIGNGDLMILKMSESGELEQIVNTPFTHWERGAASGGDFRIKWINDNTFAFEIVARDTELQMRKTGYLKIEIL